MFIRTPKKGNGSKIVPWNAVEMGISVQNEKPKTKRFQGRKYFTKVGYLGNSKKQIPRWCTDMKLLDRMVIHQKRTAEDQSGPTPD